MSDWYGLHNEERHELEECLDCDSGCYPESLCHCCLQAKVERLREERTAVLTVTEAHTGQHLWACACCSRIEAILRGGESDE